MWVFNITSIGVFFILFLILCLMAGLAIGLIIGDSRNNLPGHRNPPPPPTKKKDEV
jgi:hypothetical protein